jgi:hypothetical protein
MKDTDAKPETSLGEMHKRKETMADGRRYIIYYTFGEDEQARPKTENKEVK